MSKYRLEHETANEMAVRTLLDKMQRHILGDKAATEQLANLTMSTSYTITKDLSAISHVWIVDDEKIRASGSMS